MLFCLAMAGCDNREELTRVDTDKEATRILVELSRHGVAHADKLEKSAQRKTAWSITVPQDQLAKAREVLLQADLPRETHGGYRGMIEQGGLIPTKTEERAKLMYAMAEELARTFETYDRVVSARVHIVLPEKDPLMRDATSRPTATAMVMIKYTPSGDAAAPATTRPAGEFADAPVGKEDVQQMVARSVEGLTPSSVFVAYSRADAGAAVAATPAATASDASSAPTASAAGGTSLTADRGLLMKLFGAVALFGLISILLTAMLVREKRRQRLLALAAYSDTAMERAGT
jgi:type III secretion protein J